jgi:hypothetical protein
VAKLGVSSFICICVVETVTYIKKNLPNRIPRKMSSSSDESTSSEESTIPENVFPTYNEDAVEELYVDESCVKNDWLSVPEFFMNPKRMCAVNQFVHVTSELDGSYLSSSCELVLFGTGTSLPEHFRWMIYVTEMVGPSLL